MFKKMTKLPCKSFLLITFFLLPLLAGAQTYNSPESVVYDVAGDRYLISNTGDGSIIARSNIGILSYFSQGASTSIRGIIILGTTLYAAGDEGVMAFNLSDGLKTSTIDITEKDFLNDITADAAGNLYVSDNGNLYKVDPVAKTYSIVLATDGANGLLFDDANNRLLFTNEGPAGFDGSYISAIDMVTSGVTDLISNTFKYLDGLTIDNDGNYYVSSWETFNIYRYDPTFSSPAVEVSTGHDGPADIYFDKTNDIMAIPNMNIDTVEFKPLAALPVELTTFNASVSGNSIKLIWKTASEKNNYGFEVQRKDKDLEKAWENIGFIKGFNTSSAQKEYTFLDENPPVSSLLYRLKQINTNGSIEYSDIININFQVPTEFALDQNYPNPFNPSTTIPFSIVEAGKINLTIYNVLGEKITTLVNGYKEASKYSVKFNSSNLPSGLYFYKLTTKNHTVKKMMLVVR